MKKFIKFIFKNILKINLNTEEFDEFLYWQKDSFLQPIPIFIKKWTLNKYNLNNSVWFEIAPEYGSYRKFISKISKNVISYDFNSKNENYQEIKDSNIEIVKNSSELIDILARKLSSKEKVFLFFHSNSTPFNNAKKNYHIREVSENTELILNQKKLIEIFFKIEIIEMIKKHENLIVLIDDFNEVKKHEKFENFFIEIINNHTNWDVVSNILIVKSR